MCEIKLKMRGKAQRVARLAQTRMQNSGVTETKFIKLLSDADRSLAVLTHASVLRSSHPLWRQLPVFCEWMTTVSHHHGGSYLYVLWMNESSEPSSRRQLPVCFGNEWKQWAVITEAVTCMFLEWMTTVSRRRGLRTSSVPDCEWRSWLEWRLTSDTRWSFCTPDSHIPAISLSPRYLTPTRYCYCCYIYLYTRQSHPSHHY